MINIITIASVNMMLSACNQMVASGTSLIGMPRALGSELTLVMDALVASLLASRA